MAGENEGAQTTTGAPEGTQSVDTSQAGNTTLLTGDATQEGDAKAAPEGEAGKTDTKAADDDAGKDGDDKAGDKAGGDDADNPVEYTAFELPEGIELDEQALGRFTPIAKELKLDQQGAQKLVSLYAEMQAEQAKAFADQVAQWGEEAKNDKDIGGAKFDQSLKVAASGLQAFGSPELTALLNDTGLGNHPEVIRFCHRVGMALQEDKTLAPGSGAGAKVSAGQVLFDHPTSQHTR